MKKNEYFRALKGLNIKNAEKSAQYLTLLSFRICIILSKRFKEKSGLNIFEEMIYNKEFRSEYINLLFKAEIDLSSRKKGFKDIEDLLDKLIKLAIKTKRGGIA